MSDFLSNFEKANKNAKRLSNKILIDGKLISPSTDSKIKVINPSTGEGIGDAPKCNKVDVDHAVKSSLNAFKEWKKIPARERGKLVEQGARKLEERRDEIETLLSPGHWECFKNTSKTRNSSINRTNNSYVCGSYQER
jgi:acyl-CoA reductase-like NAD-dependent aldehyde dehydrogenase